MSMRKQSFIYAMLNLKKEEKCLSENGSTYVHRYTVKYTSRKKITGKFFYKYCFLPDLLILDIIFIAGIDIYGSSNSILFLL